MQFDWDEANARRLWERHHLLPETIEAAIFGHNASAPITNAARAQRRGGHNHCSNEKGHRECPCGGAEDRPTPGLKLSQHPAK